MKTFLLLLSLIAIARSEVVTLVSESYHRDSIGGDAGPNSAADCPNDFQSGSPNKCILSESPTITGNTYEYSGATNLRTQLLTSSANPADSQAAIDKSVMKSVVATGSEHSRFITITISMDTAGDSHVYEGCNVELTGGMGKYSFIDMKDSSGNLLTGGEQTQIGQGVDANKGAFSEDGSTYSCTFMVANNMYIGTDVVKVQFQTPEDSQIGGNVRIRSVNIPIVFKPHSTDPTFTHALANGFLSAADIGAVNGQVRGSQNTMLRDVVVGYEDYCESRDGGYFTKVKPTGGCALEEDLISNPSVSPPKSGAIHLRVSGIFLDQRYKVKTPSGVAELPQAVGGIKITKESLHLNPEYARFNDPTKDVFDTDGISISLNPIPYTAYKDGTATVVQRRKDQSSSADTDFSNHGTAFTGGNDGTAKLPSYLAAVDEEHIKDGVMPTSGALSKSDAYGSYNCYAQYEFTHVFEFKYGDLPNMHRHYIGTGEPCGAIECPHGLNIQMFSENGVYQVDSRVSISREDLPEDDSYIDVTYPDLVASNLFRQPGEVQFSDIFIAGDIDLVNVRSQSYRDLDVDITDDFNDLFSYEVDDPRSVTTSVVMGLGTKCAPLTSGLQLKHLAKPLDISARLNAMISNPSCKIDLPLNYYGTVQTINYHAGGIDGNTAQASAYITEIDTRTVKLSTDGSKLLRLYSRTTIEGFRVATTIALQLKKLYTDVTPVPVGLENAGTPLNQRAVVYRVHGDDAALSGFLNGGGECAGNNLFWTSTASRDDYRVYKPVWAGSETDVRANFPLQYYSEEDADKGRPYGTCTGGTHIPGIADSSTDCPGDALAGSVAGSCLGGTWGGSSPLLVRYRACKAHGGTWKIVSLPDAEVLTVASADDTCKGDACGSGDHNEQCLFGGCAYLGYSTDCAQPADQEQALIRVQQEGVGVDHVLTTTDRCTGTLKFQVEDTTRNNEFAIYKVQTECSRMSQSNIDDSVDLHYEYSGDFNLEINKFSVTATPSSPVLNDADSMHQVICDKNDLSASPPLVCRTKGSCEVTCGGTGTSTYSVVPFFGTCDSSTNEIDQTNILNVADCENHMGIIPSNTNRGFDVDSFKSKFEKDSGNDDGMDALKKCSNSVTFTSDNYIITYEVGMQYTRFLLHDPSMGIKYCDSQKFVTTINRKATASVTTTNIVAAALNRAVYVQDIGWLSDSDCGADNYRLHVLMVALDQDSRTTDTSAWLTADLTAAFIDSAASALNPNNMEIYAHSSDGKTIHASGGGAITAVGDALDSTFASNGDRFQVRSQCIAISGSCAAIDTDGTVDGDSWADFSQAAFETDVVIRGLFQSKAIDTRVKLGVSFEECPLEDAAAVEGQTFIGLHSTCDNVLNEEDFDSQSVGQPETDAWRKTPTLTCDGSGAQHCDSIADPIELDKVKYDCTSANADDVLRVDADVFAVAEECTVEKTLHSGSAFDSACKLDKAKYDEAIQQGWSITSTDIYLDRSIVIDDVETPQTPIKVCECAAGACAVPSGFQTAVSSSGLDEFKRINSGAFERGYLACGRHGSSSETSWSGVLETGTELAQMQLPLMPLSEFPNDVFKIRYEAILTSSLLRRRRMLRAVVPIKLRSSALAEGSTHAISVIQVASESYNEGSPAGSSSGEAPATSGSSSGDAPAAGESSSAAVPVSDAVSAGSTTESSSSGLSTGAIVGIVVACVVVLLVAAMVGFNLCGVGDMCCRQGQGAARNNEETTPFVGAVPSSDERFSNLRY